MKRLILIFMIMLLTVPNTIFAAEFKSLPLGFNDINSHLSIVNYKIAGLPLTSVTLPSGYGDLSDDGLVQVPTAVISITPETGLTTQTNVVWSSSKSISPVGAITKVEWKLNDVAIPTPPSTFSKVGINKVTLRVQNSNGTWSPEVSKTVTVLVQPTAVIGMTPSSGLLTTTSVTWSYNNSIVASGVSIASVEWKVDGSIVAAPPSTFASGAHTVNLRVKDSRGLWSDYVSKTFTVLAQRPTAVISMSPSTGIYTSTIVTWGSNFSTFSSGGSIVESEWKSDGVIVATPPSTFTEGTHTVELRVKDSQGLWSDTVIRTFTVTTPYPVLLNFAFSQTLQTWTVPATGTYKLEVWGAQGGSYKNTGGKGGYAYGNLRLTQGQVVNIVIGGLGGITESTGVSVGGWNGGGLTSQPFSTGGGGGTDIRVGGLELKDRVLVAGGGGGSAYYGYVDAIGGNGGGTSGGDGGFIPDSATSGGHGGTQSSGGSAGTGSCTSGDAGSLGLGGKNTNGCGSLGSGSGGGGYYGGGGASYGAGGGGGSSYIGGVLNGGTTPGVQTGHGKVTITSVSFP
jgi:PKD repeat protein